MPGRYFAGLVDDGSLLIGNIGHDDVQQAFRWTAQFGIEYLPPLPADHNSAATKMSADGRRILGSSSQDPSSPTTSVLWVSGQPRSITQLLAGVANVPQGASLSLDTINASGTVVTGNATLNDGSRGWLMALE